MSPDLTLLSSLVIAIMSLLVVALVSMFFSCLSWPLGSARTTVRHLPWFDGPLPFHLETGYVEVDEVNEAHMFYYFMKSENNSAEDPLLVWHTGGPRCSALTGLILEIGPLRFDVSNYNEGKPCLVYSPYTWTKMANIIFVDSPIGTGFSYSKSPGYLMSDTKSALQLYTFIEKWMMDHPEFLTNPLYIGGDSYAGRIVPMTVQNIANGNQGGDWVPLNLKGYLVGNPPTDSRYDNVMIPYAHGMGLLSDELYESVKRSCGGNSTDAQTLECGTSILSAIECLAGINFAHILEPPCSMSYIVKANTSEIKTYLPVECRNSTYYLLQFWANMDSVQDALDVREGTVKYWERCSEDIKYLYIPDVSSIVPYHQDVTTRGYRALVYSGDHDMEVPHIGTQAWIRSLNYPIVDHWRPWFINNQVGGYTKSYFNELTFATIKGAGHAAPEYLPKECQAMFSRWVSNAPL